MVFLKNSLQEPTIAIFGIKYSSVFTQGGGGGEVEFLPPKIQFVQGLIKVKFFNLYSFEQLQIAKFICTVEEVHIAT